MKNAIKYLMVLIVPVMVATSCKKDVSEKETETPTNGNGGGTKPPVENPYNSKVETKLPVQKGITVNVNGNIGGYMQALPYLYDSTTKRYPLLIFIHGVGELGNGADQLPIVAGPGVPGLIKNKKFPANFKVGDKNFSFIVISPQIRKWDYATMAKDINDMISYAIKKYRIDTARIYVSGLSMGGGYTWEVGAAYAKRLAAIVPICGAATLSDAKAKTVANAKLAVWALHNDDDKTVAPGNSKTSVSRINANSPAIPAQLTIWPTGGHDAWTKATDPNYRENGKNIYEWMLQYSR